MKLNELGRAVAEACDARAKLVMTVQEETFRQILAAVQKGQRVQIPEFGIFVGKDADDDGEGPKVIRFRPVASPQRTTRAEAQEMKKEGAAQKKGASSRLRKREQQGWAEANSEGSGGAVAIEPSETGTGND